MESGRRRRRRATALLLLGLLAASPARAEQTPVGIGFLWGVAAFEALAAVAIGLNLGVDAVHDSDFWEPFVLILPGLLAAGIGALAGWQEAPVAIPKAVHGALWTGFDLFLVGVFADGAASGAKDGMRLGPTAYALAAAGAGLGAAWGATQIPDGDATAFWFGAPYGSTVAALGTTGLLMLVGWARQWDDRTLMQSVGWSSVGWLTAGLGAAYASPWIMPDRADPAGSSQALSTGALGRFAPHGAPLPGASLGRFDPR